MSTFQVVAIVISLALTAVAVVLTTRAVRSITGVVRTGQPSMPRNANPVGRTVTMVKETMLHTRMLQWTVVGVMHWFVYFAFIVLGAAVFTAYFQLFDPEFQLPVIGHFFLYEWLGEILGVLGTIGIVYLAIYRQKHHPRSEGRNSRFYRSTMWQAYFVEAMALLEGSAILFIRGAEYNLGKVVHPTGDDADHYTRLHFPVSGFFGDLLYPAGAASEDTLRTIIFAIAMIKIVLAMIWLIVIARNLTMGVAWHRFTAWFNIWWKREPSGRTALGAMKPLVSGGKALTLDDIDDLDEDSKLGVGAVEDFSWKNILDFTTCTECGRCQSQCPAWNTEKPLNPKLLITALRDATYAKAPYTQALQAHGEDAANALLEGNGTLTREVARPLIGDTGDDWFYNPESGAAVIDPEVLWNCTSCGACVQQCPVDIEHVDHIMDMRRHAILVESNFPAELNGLFKGLENKGNPWNMSSTARMDWAKGLDFEVKVVGAKPEDGGIESLDEVEWLFWVGCAGAYEDRAKKTTRAVAELLDMAGVSFGVLGNGETCTGDPARRAGNEFVFQGLAQQNVEVLKEARVKKVVSTCAHCFNTLKNEYQDFGIELEVVHHTQLLNRLVREGKLTPVNDGAGAHKRSITYHDPCYIGRHNGVYEPPRELLQVLPGAEYVEMERSAERSFCCGAGGARMWMEENIGERINMNRTREAVATGADQIAVGCPFCRVMLSDGLTMAQSKDDAREEVEVLDVAQMLLASVKGEMATKLAPGSTSVAASNGTSSAGTSSAGSAGSGTQDVATKAEPEEGDETITEDTVVTTADAGPLAKASGGTSLFDDAAGSEGETANEDKSPAEEAQAAKPASSGGSLFDVTSNDDVDTDDAPPAASTEKAGAPQPDAKAPAAGADLGSGGSLFDLGGDEPAEATATTGTTEKSDQPAEPQPDADAKTPAPAAGADLGSGGSLFDIGGDEPAASAVEAVPAPADEADLEATPAQPAAALGSTGSLFDIAAPAVEQRPAPAAAASPAPEPDVTPEPEPEPPQDPTPEPTTAAEAPPSTVSTSTPGAEIPDGGSLFDIPAPEATTVEKRAAAEPEPSSAPEPEPAPTSEADASASTPAQQISAAATAAAGSDEPEPVQPEAEGLVEETPGESADPASETKAEVADQPQPTEEAPQPEAAEPTTGGATNTPKTDVDISDAGSLFDL